MTLKHESHSPRSFSQKGIFYAALISALNKGMEAAKHL